MIVIFDLDGTVWDSQEGIVGSLEHVFSTMDLPTPPREQLAANLGPPLQVMLAELGIPDELNETATLRYRERYVAWGAYQAAPYPGVVELLERLGSQGHRLATATSKGEGPTRQMLEHFALMQHFEVVGAATMDGSATTKALVLERALAGLGDPDPDECLMVGDRHYDVAGAAEHGIATVGVLWGYGSEHELRSAGARHVVEHPSGVAALVEQLSAGPRA